jgi:ankyrin repeat protein
MGTCGFRGVLDSKVHPAEDRRRNYFLYASNSFIEPKSFSRIFKRNKKTTPPAVKASWSRDASELRRLVEADPSQINARDPKGCTALYAAAVWGNPEIVSFIISCGADVNIADNAGATPLFIACALNHTEAVRVLLDSSADLSISTYFGSTPMQFALDNNRRDIVRILRERDARGLLFSVDSAGAGNAELNPDAPSPFTVSERVFSKKSIM